MTGDLAESPTVRDLCLSAKKMPSDKMMVLLDALSTIPALDLASARATLVKLMAKIDSSELLRSEHDQHRDRLRATVVGQKVSLSKHQEALSKQDAEYSKLVNRIDLELRGFFTKYLVRPKDLCLHEILVFDSRNQCREALRPAPRQTVERALSRPHDYLACDCCTGEEGLSATHPTTALLYQMYLESGSVINMADLWAAFEAMLEPEEDEEPKIEDEIL